MRKPWIKHVFFAAIILSILLISLLVKEAGILLAFMLTGFIVNFFLFKTNLPWNLAPNFFLSIVIITNFNVVSFIIFFLVVEIVPRIITGKDLSERAITVYLIWIVLAFVSLNFKENIVFGGIVLTIARYILVSIRRMVGGKSIAAALVETMPQLIINGLCFVYLTGPIISLLN